MPKFVNAAAAEKWAQITYGCSVAVALACNGGPLSERGSFAQRYRSQKNAAACRGIAWNFTLPEWVRIWCASGKWAKRGVGIGRYCMARHGDAGAYEAGNVSIQLSTQNSRDGIEVARPAILESMKNAPRTGSGRGWTLRQEARFKKPYQVMVGSKYIGCFATQAEAESAYLDAAQKIRHISRSKEVA